MEYFFRGGGDLFQNSRKCFHAFVIERGSKSLSNVTLKEFVKKILELKITASTSPKQWRTQALVHEPKYFPCNSTQTVTKEKVE